MMMAWNHGFLSAASFSWECNILMALGNPTANAAYLRVQGTMLLWNEGKKALNSIAVCFVHCGICMFYIRA